MIGNLLFKLGVFKISKEESKSVLYKIHDSIADSIKQDGVVDDIDVSEQRAEVKMFFWFMGGLPLIPQFQDKPFFDVVHNNIYEVIFSEVLEEIRNDEHFLTFDDVSDIYDLRNEFYQKLRNSKNSYELQRLLKKVSEYMFETPFSKEESETENFLNSLTDFKGGMDKSIYINELMKNVVPVYEKSMRAMFKKVK